MQHFRGKLLGLVAADITKLINKDKVSLFKRSRKGIVRIKLYSYWCEYLLVKIMLDDLRTKVKELILINTGDSWSWLYILFVIYGARSY